MSRKYKRNKKSKKVFKAILILMLLSGITLFSLYHFGIIGKDDIPIVKEEKLKILDLDSKTRPYAVMIDNVKNAKPHSGLDKAYLTYEIIVEGGLTRLMAVFKDVDIEEIGPVRSARHYFVDYAMENDAIYIHHGRSPQALDQINKYNVNDIEALYNPSDSFWRDNSRYAPHNSYTSTKRLKKAIEDKKYETKSNDWQLLNYSVKPINLKNKENSKKADKVVIYFSDFTYTTLEYNQEKEVYLRYENGEAHTDKNGTHYTAKNIIVVTGVRNYTIDSSTNRQEIENIGKGKGYFITNGYAVPITWEKSNTDSKTIYRYEKGKKIKVNDGNTYIEIQPLNKKLEITGTEQTSTNN